MLGKARASPAKLVRAPRLSAKGNNNDDDDENENENDTDTDTYRNRRGSSIGSSNSAKAVLGTCCPSSRPRFFSSSSSSCIPDCNHFCKDSGQI